MKLGPVQKINSLQHEDHTLGIALLCEVSNKDWQTKISILKQST
jgi:hypothetical protein